MQKLRIDQDIKPLSEVRSSMATYIRQIHETRRPLIITQRGKSAAVLVDVQEFEAMQEKIELLSDIHSSLSQLEKGEGINHKDAKNMLLERISE
ncbi:type II toxin-antitoxin system Phd/YefM family antitoxin [Desulfobacula sp.]|uniref:type II toxin-antitoxin system Phd/YefM family antitoxin n=1 Tax=Desulfobacula sp. TaxID=2593537 RepID=UPI0025C139C5|nr:type II toxin-antitoxin system Phd/YefM family antitoxin [Desulfobacula sp.]MBC2705666.1 type II toxin-antitoxin system Phd/YefM family antitoxin [Desulfobacula sp.]